jgi:hypothetical protein
MSTIYDIDSEENRKTRLKYEKSKEFNGFRIFDTRFLKQILNWLQLGNDIDGEDEFDGSGLSVSLNSAGDRVAIGAVGNDGANGTNSGHTRVFEWDGSNWLQLGNDIDGEAAFDDSGFSVSLNSVGDRVAIGAFGNDGANGSNSGHTRVFEWDGSNWQQLGNDIDGEAADDFSGYSVSLNSAGDRVAIGAIENDGANGMFSGHTRVFEWDGSNWQQLGNDIDGEAVDDFSGFSVSLNSAGDRVAIGSEFNGWSEWVKFRPHSGF